MDKKYLYLFVAVVGLVSLSCNLPFAVSPADLTKTAETPINATEVAQTVIAQLTNPAPNSTITASFTPQPGVDTPTVTSTNVPPTATLPATQTSRPCNQAVFISDVTIPDGMEIETNANFTKTWRLQNTGSCTWNSGYHVIFDSGDRMNAPDAVSVTGGSVPNGGTVDVSVSLRAPGSAGSYRGNFRLRSADGVVFGIGGGGTFYVQITAVAPVVEEPPPPAAQPDLKITNITLDPATPVKGNPVTVKVSTYNSGNAASGPYVVRWWPGENYGSPACQWNVDNSNASGGRVLSCVYAGYPSHYPNINTKAQVDVNNTVDESNEGNNVMLKAITVTN